MKKNIKVKEEINLESVFYFLSEIKTYSKMDEPLINFIKSLNLTDEQYIKLANLISDYGDSRYDDGVFNEQFRDDY